MSEPTLAELKRLREASAEFIGYEDGVMHVVKNRTDYQHHLRRDAGIDVPTATFIAYAHANAVQITETLEREKRELVEALQSFGRHKSGLCHDDEEEPICYCGLDELLAKHRETR